MALSCIRLPWFSLWSSSVTSVASRSCQSLKTIISFDLTYRRLLPSAIEDGKEWDPKMKRNAREVEGDTPKTEANDGPKETKPKPNPASKRISINREEIAKVMMAQSQAARQATLGLPFQARNEVGKKVPGPSKSQTVSVQRSCLSSIADTCPRPITSSPCTTGPPTDALLSRTRLSQPSSDTPSRSVTRPRPGSMPTGSPKPFRRE